MGVVFSNNAATTLSSAISTSDTTIAVADASAFPTLSGSDYTYATLEDASNNVEVVKVTAISSNNLTVTRAQDSTTARAFSSGDRCQLRLNAALLNDATFSRSFNDLTDVPSSTFTNANATKLAGIETAATADQTASEIKALYETETNAFTDAQFTKLAGIETGATADQTGSQIKTLYEAQNSAFTDAQFTKLAGIETGATADQIGSEIKALYEAESSAFTDAQFTKLAGIETGATGDQTAAEIKSLYEGTANAWTYAQFTKLAGIEAGAQVVTTALCTAVGCLMDTELDDLVGVKTLTLPNATNITSFGKDVVGSADSAAARVFLDLENSDIKSYYEANSDTNAFTDADHAKLNAIESNATADQTDAQIKTAYENNSDTNAFTDADHTKLDGIEASATADQSNAEIETAYNAQIGQISSSERTAGSSTSIKRFAPADVKSMIDTHAGSSFSGDVSISGGTTSITNGAVTMAKIENISSDSILGRITGGGGPPEVMTADQVLTFLRHTNDKSRIVFAKSFSNTMLVIYSANNMTIAWDSSDKQIKWKTATGSSWGFIDGSHLFVGGSNSTASTTPTGFSDDITSTQNAYKYISDDGSLDSNFSLDDNYGAVDRFTIIKEGHGGTGYPSFEGIVFCGHTSHVTIVLREINS